MKPKFKKFVASVFFQIGVNCIGLPDLIQHKIRYNRTGRIVKTEIIY